MSRAIRIVGVPMRRKSLVAAALMNRAMRSRLMPVTARSLSRASAAYAATLGSTPLDVVHLGVGDDGHTASWPPGDPVVDSADDVAVCGVFNGRVRMTLTPRIVNRARARLVLVSGANKAHAIAGWLVGGEKLPVARVRRTNTTLIADRAATAELPDGLVDRRQ